MNTTRIKVIFRKFNHGGDIIALFPDEEFTYSRTTCQSYQHVGQHGEADYNYCVRISKPATPQEYKALLNELIGRGYALNIRSRK